MRETGRCSSCGLSLDASSPGGLCPACLLKLGIAAGDAATALGPPSRGASGPGSGAAADTPRVIGPYRLVRTLGEGGMGVVHLAEQTEPIRRHVALKVIKLGMDTRDVVARFESERQALALMDHPNIARVIDAGATPDGRPFFVMEYVAGVPITDYCDAHRLSTRARIELVAEICGAIQHAHQKGIIHRDLKPSNVLVMEQDGTPTPKIIDFGIAKATDQRLTERTMFTEQGQFMGTPEYMSPEQTGIAGLDVDATTDIYSLGVLMYELLAGALPFEPAALRKAGYAEMQRIIREDEPPKPSTRVSTLGATATDIAARRHTDSGSLRKLLAGDLDWITLKAMEKDRTRRYASASEFAADIARYLHNEPVLASPPSAAYRAKKFVRRNRVGVTAASLVALAVVSGLIVSSVLYVREGRAHRDAVAQKTEADAQRTAATDARQRADANAAHADANAARAEEQRIRAEDQRSEADKQRAEAVAQAYVSGLATVATGLERFADKGDISFELLRLRDAPVALRNWEWRYLAAKLYSVKVQLFAPASAHGPLALSPDGRVFWATDQILVGWDMASSRRTVFRSEEDPIAALDPSGRFVLRIRAGRNARLATMSTAALVATLPASDRPIVVAAFSPRGFRLATATADGAIRVWQPESGSLMHEIAGVTGTPTALHFAPDDTSLLAVTSTSAFLVPLAPPSSPRPLTGFNDPDVATFSADSQSVWFGDKDGKLHRIDVASGRETGVLAGFAGQVTDLAVSHDGRWLATGASNGGNGLIRLWDVATQAPFAVMTASDSSEGGGAMAFSPDDRYLAAGTERARVMVWDVTRLRLTHGIAIGSAPDRPIALSVDGRWAVAADGTRITRWDLESRPLSSLELRSNQRVDTIKAVAVTADGSVAAGTGSGAVWLWSGPGRDPVRFDVGLDGSVSVLGFSPDGRRLAAGGGKGDVRAWDVGTGLVCFRTTLTVRNAVGGQIRWVGGPLGGPPNEVAFDASGQRLVTLHGDSTIDFDGGLSMLSRVAETWDISSGRRLSSGRYDVMESIAFTADGTRSVATRESNPLLKAGQLEIRRLADHALLASSDIRVMGLREVAASPDGSRLAGTGDGGPIHVFDARSGRVVLSFMGRREQAVAVRFSRDGARLTVAYQDGVVQVLDATTSFSVDFSVDAALDPLWGAADADRQIASDPQLTPQDRADARALMARARDRDPAEIQNARSWAIAGVAGRTATAYRAAVQAAQQAVDLAPWSPEYAGSLGIAQYRAGDHATALTTLTRSLDRWKAASAIWKSSSSNGSTMMMANGKTIVGDPLRGAVLASAPIVRAFRVMCLQQLGRTVEARSDVEQVRVVARKSKNDRRLAGFLKEADAVVTDAEARTAANAAAHRQARALVNTLFANASMFSDDVIEQVEADRALSAGVRDAALRMARALVDDPAELNTASWTVVKIPGATLEIYRIALRRSEKATSLVPNQPGRLNTLALAQYRAGSYQEALGTIARIAALRKPTTSDLVVSVLIRLRLGQHESARADLDVLAKMTNLADEMKALVKEAQALWDRGAMAMHQERDPIRMAWGS